MFAQKNIFGFSFSISLLFYLIYLYFGGFGWDGDSFISASQFVKLFNPDLYGMFDHGTVPKLFSILTFGLIYQIFHSFEILTFASILLNALMISILVRWIAEKNGFWLIVLAGILLYTNWTKMVIACDNNAFSFPFIVFGSYFYFQRNRKITGLVLLFVSGLFRPGAELILLAFIIYDFVKGSHSKSLLAFGSVLLIFMFFHTLFGYLLSYTTKEDFLEKCVIYGKHTKQFIPHYQYSYHAIFPFMKSVLHQVFSYEIIPFLIPGLSAIYSLKKKVTLFPFVLILIPTLILPVCNFYLRFKHADHRK